MTDHFNLEYPRNLVAAWLYERAAWLNHNDAPSWRILQFTLSDFCHDFLRANDMRDPDDSLFEQGRDALITQETAYQVTALQIKSLWQSTPPAP